MSLLFLERDEDEEYQSMEDHFAETNPIMKYAQGTIFFCNLSNEEISFILHFYNFPAVIDDKCSQEINRLRMECNFSSDTGSDGK